MLEIQQFNDLKILVVDDETAIQKILTQYFKAKHQVITFNSANDALDWLYQGNLPDIIIADFNMPVLNGFQFISQLKSSGFFCTIPLIMLSGENNSDTKIRCLEAGADDFVIKPFNPRELQARITSILRRSKLIQPA